MHLVVRFDDGRPLEHAAIVLDAVWSIDPDVPISGVETMQEVLDESTKITRFIAILMTGFGALALSLGAVGVFGVTAYTAGARLPEFGVRIALGSRPAGVLKVALRSSLVPIAAGMGIGVVGALGAARFLEVVLYQVSSTDPATYAAVAIVLVAVGVSAALLPAWRASRVDPVSVLGAD